MNKIVPALLTDRKEDLINMMNICAEFTDYVQVDIMDGDFVPSKSIIPSDLEGWKPVLDFEAHLMVMDPLSWLDSFKKIGAKRLIYHFEIEGDHEDRISRIKQQGFEVGIAVNPYTQAESFKNLIKLVDTVLFMSVVPGFYGSEFISGVLEKIKKVKCDYPDKQIGIDGGVKSENLIRVRDSGVDYICVGSAILKSSDPKKSYQELVNILNG